MRLTFKAHNNAVVAGSWSPDGQWVATAGGSTKEIRIWSSRTGKQKMLSDSSPLILRGSGRTTWATGVSSDGQWIGWGNTWRRQAGGTGHSSELGSPVQFMLSLPVKERGLGVPERSDAAGVASVDWLRATRHAGNLSLNHRRGGDYGGGALLDVREGDKLRATMKRGRSDSYQHRSYSFHAGPTGNHLWQQQWQSFGI